MMTTFEPHSDRPWTSAEDKQLRAAVGLEKEQGRPVKWDAIAASLPRRSKKECRKRWHHTMMEAVKTCKWKPEEDERLVNGAQKFGKNWVVVAQVVMTRNDSECMERWDQLQAQDPANTGRSDSPSMWAFESFNPSPPSHRDSVSSLTSSSTDFHHDSSSSSYSSYGSLSGPTVDTFLHNVVGNMSHHSTHYNNDTMDIDPSRLHSSPQPTSTTTTTTIDPRQGTNIDPALEAFINFDADPTDNSPPPTTDHFAQNDWSWLDGIGSPAGTNHPHFGIDTHPRDLSPHSGTRDRSCPPLEVMPYYPIDKSSSSGARVVIVCKSNDSRTLDSLDEIMKALEAGGHEVIQGSAA